MTTPTDITYHLYQSDLPPWYLDAARQIGKVACDIETSGLDWKADRIATCQVYVRGEEVAIVRIGEQLPQQLCALLEDTQVTKLFHHAMFDLRFMANSWSIHPKAIQCTKIAIKLLDPDHKESHSLKPLLESRLGLVIDKAEQVSNWFAPELTPSQLSYAANDVMYLSQLLTVLEAELAARNLFSLAQACFEHIPTRVQLDLGGYGDVYTY